MSQTDTSIREILAPYAQGEGVQHFTGDTPPFAEVPVQNASIVDGCKDASLDFVIAGPEWHQGPIPASLLQEWRRVLAEGAFLAILFEGKELPVDLIARYVAREVGLAMENPIPVKDDLYLLVGTRSFKHSLLQVTEILGKELARPDKPEGWDTELRFSLGSLLLNAGEALDAAAFFQAALQDEPTSSEAKIGLALSMGLQGNGKAAETLLTEVLRVDPQNPIAREWLERFKKALLQPTGQAPTQATPTGSATTNPVPTGTPGSSIPG